jgi:trans-2,3-dihydro-3-hydroxyanthranilate isomerase
VSVGLPFLAVELTTRDALRRALPDKVAYSRILPLDGAHSIYAYTSAPDPDDEPCDWQARMFTSTPYEDPATGSATAAVSGLRADLTTARTLDFRIRQGVDMGRPSTLLTKVLRTPDGALTVRLAGDCVAVMAGAMRLADS